jgi:hypothetical protein
MGSSKRVALLVSSIATLIGAAALSDTATTGASPAALDTGTDVIVVLKDQLAAVPATRDLRAARSAALAASRAPIVAELQRVQARKVHGFAMINAVAATVSRAEAAQLAAHPLVAAVVPDAIIRAPKHAHAAGTASRSAAAAAAGSSALCNTLEPEALQLTHTAFLDPAIPQAQQVVDGQGHKVTGQGVKVAFLADGVDPTLPGYVRPDGTSVFMDYQDFSGDPPGTPTDGGEAFGDSSSIAAQDYPNGKLLTYDISAFVNPAYPLPSPCNIQIRGMAPGAALVGLKVFSNLGYTTTSGFVQAIEYAVVNDDVDVINESFSSFYYPDDLNDPVSLANKAAVDAGVTVVGITYDGGTAGTFESPGTDPWVLAMGASTQYRSYAQTGSPLGSLIKPGAGWLDNNISPLSSAGFAQTGARTTDAVAPGDLGWALCSTDEALYNDCVSFAGNPTPIQVFGGTSESAPLTSGEAALIIQAYRSTHRGASPSPALIKRIIMSTATDLGAPASEQGAGLINALAAVHLALTIKDANATSAGYIDQENVPKTASFTITNSGSAKQVLIPHLQTLGKPFAGATLSIPLNAATSPEFIDEYGYANAYAEKKFTVPGGAQHLDVAIAFKTPLGTTPVVQLTLLDPSGRLATYSIPQGSGSGYGHADVVKPAAGEWTAVVYTFAPAAQLPALQYTGPVELTWSAERYVDWGSVSPAILELVPGAAGTLTAQFKMPDVPGDLAAGIRFEPVAGASTPGEIPVTLRTLIPISSRGGEFSGTLTGGNSRAGVAPTQIFAFDVPAGVRDMSLTLDMADKGYVLAGMLIDPNGMQVSVEGNLDNLGNSQDALQLFHFDPQPGSWRFLLLQNFVSSGNQTSLPFSARIAFNAAKMSAPGLPTAGEQLSASGKPLTVPVKVTNTGAVTAAFFADARLQTRTTTTLSGLPFCAVTTLPGTCTGFLLPTEVSDVVFTAQSAAPITMDAYNIQGYGEAAYTYAPDIYAKQVTPNTIAASLREPEIPYGTWVVDPALIGPYGPAGALTASVTTGARVTLLPFDRTVSATSGDYWADQTLGTSTYNPLVLAPGESGTITLTITPDPKQVGDTVEGYIFIDTYNTQVNLGDEVVRLPYRYTIGR